MATFNGIIQLGTFYHNGEALSLPTRPWWSKNYPGNLSGKGNGNTSQFSGNMSDWTIGDTSSDDNKKLRWVKIKDGNRTLLICDRNILNNMHWDALNNAGYVDGTNITIDGNEYLCRLLSGGETYRVKDNRYSGGTPTDNEWDRFICNEDNIKGLPIPQDYDLANIDDTYKSFDGNHNQTWHWWGSRSWCKETYTESSSYHIFRGDASARYLLEYSTYNGNLGWRPVLEYIETDPPEKPVIIEPIGTETAPLVTNTKPIKIETTFHNPSGTFKHMDYEIWDLDLNKRVTNIRVFKTTDVVSIPGEIGHRYKLMVTHTNTADQVSSQTISYFIWGMLNKYKLSEPITVKQYDKIKSYTSGENLIMKPQTFPETENSRLRLVPETMNNLTAGETNTKELEFSASTKQPTIGDRLIKNKEIYTVSEVIGGTTETNIASEVYKVTDVDKPNLLFSRGTGQKAYVHNGRVYIPTISVRDTNPKYGINIKSIALDGTAPQAHGAMNSNTLESVAITGKDNKVYLVIAEPKKFTLWVIDTDTGKPKFSSIDMANTILSVSATVDSKTNHLVVATKEYNSSTSTYHIVCYWFDVSNPDKITTFTSHVFYNDSNINNVSFPFVTDTQNYREGNISISFVKKYSETQLQLVEAIYTSSGQVGNVSRGLQDGINAVNSRVYSKLFKDDDGKFTWMIAYSYQEGANKMKVATYAQIKENGSYQNYWTTLTPEYIKIPFLRLTYDKLHGFMLLYSFSDDTINQTSTQSAERTWGEISEVTKVVNRDSAQVFEIVDYNPYAYGKYPGLLLLEYDASNRTDRIMLRSDYAMEAPKENKLVLDRPITTQAGEVIKFLDYDLEVKAGEETAKIKPTNITNDYYEYDAEFEKKQEERKVTVVGRNSKLTTLYYYNY
ncbi:hypothetical protein P9J83_11900 [Clostridium sporogenes]|uniref:Uncharacterized protein n=1 Tax=Clostridium sporogenes TaxID=1509 RepID=A0AAE4JVM7_CLOSG|nr:hypothetical protein [Clostridium sporogenes]MDS1004194.1 hypothetical protein [Clostridium sporogenes]